MNKLILLIVKWIIKHDKSAPDEPLLFIHKSDVEYALGLKPGYLTNNSKNK